MKKRKLILTITMMFLTIISGCSYKKNELPQLQKLENDKVLHVGNNVFYNTTDTTTVEKYITYQVFMDYKLRRSSSSYNSNNYVYYNGYYYYWEIETTEDEKFLGKIEITNSIQYDYLILGKDNTDIVVKKNMTEQVKHSYNSGWIEEIFQYSINLSNYFTSFDELKKNVPELAEKIDISGKKKYYIDTVVPTQVDVETNTYNDYYYFEEVKR